MNPIAVVVEAVVNALRVIRNGLARLLPAPDFVVLEVRGSLPERRPTPPGMLRRLFPRVIAAPPDESLEEWRERLRLLAAEPRVRGVVIKIGQLSAGPASLEALRRALLAFRRAGKRVVAYLVAADLSAYYLTTAADTIAAPESAELSLNGPRVEATFLRVALDRLGIMPQFHHIAEYKTAANRYLYPQMTDAQREMLNSLLDDLYDGLVTAAAEARRVPVPALRDAIDQGVLAAQDARARGLIDLIAYEDELGQKLMPAGAGAESRPPRLIPWPQARRRIHAPYRWRSLQRQVIGVVELVGAIIPGESRELPLPVPLLGRHLAGHETVARAFRLVERIPAVKAIVFHVESPGGSAVASDMIWREVARIQQKTPVVVHMGNVAGSGGYYVACGARHIVAGANTITGSIGVVSGKFNVQGLFAKGGLRREILARGESATMFSAFTPFTESHWEVVRARAEDVYRRFKARVATGRQMSEPDVEDIARGRVWSGRQAVAHGLVDETGDFEVAVQKAKALAGIPAEMDVPVVTIRPPRAMELPIAPAGLAQALRSIQTLLSQRALLLMPSDVIPFWR